MPDTHPTYEDRAYGGAGRDVLIANTGGDRLIDWVGEFNSYLVPFAPFGMATVSRTLQPQSAGVPVRAVQGGRRRPDAGRETRARIPGRNGEPDGELGLVLQKDFAWQDQTGAPADPQAGNIPGGQRDVLRVRELQRRPGAMGFFADSGTWITSGGVLLRHRVRDSRRHQLYNFDHLVAAYYEVVTNMKLTGNGKTGYMIFDYQSKTDFKYAGLDANANLMRIGQRTAAGWIDKATLSSNFNRSNQTPMLVVNGSRRDPDQRHQDDFLHLQRPAERRDARPRGERRARHRSAP